MIVQLHVVSYIYSSSDRVIAREMALVLVLVAAALLQTVRTETTTPDAQDNHSNNGELNCMYNFYSISFSHTKFVIF